MDHVPDLEHGFSSFWTRLDFTAPCKDGCMKEDIAWPTLKILDPNTTCLETRPYKLMPTPLNPKPLKPLWLSSASGASQRGVCWTSDKFRSENKIVPVGKRASYSGLEK